MAHRTLDHRNSLVQNSALSHYLHEPQDPASLKGLDPETQMWLSALNSQTVFRPTTEVFPHQLPNLSLPLGVFVQPVGEAELPVVRFKDQVILRCNHCRAYINPFFKFKSEGTIFVCNICDHEDQVLFIA